MEENPRHVESDAAGAEAVDQFQQESSTASPTPQQSSKSADDLASQFLQLIVPGAGPYVAYIVEPTRKYNKFAPTIEELWEIIKAADKAGHTAYHACASYKEARHDPKGTPQAQRRWGRTNYNAYGAKAFWLDIDAGPGKPYPDWQAAWQAVLTFCQATGLPIPSVVRSGLGIHVYWPLAQTLDPENWKRYARGLKALCVKHGLQADPSRTADITSVLRTPGTHHRKAGVRLVQCGELVGPYGLDQFAVLGSVTGTAHKFFLNAQFGPLPTYRANRRSGGVGERLRRLSRTFRPSFAGRIAERCEQVRTLRDTKGQLLEPLWYAALGVLAFAEDGEQLAHEWSSGDDRYTIEETKDRLDRYRQFGPTTCANFYEHNPTICERCPWWEKIKSPIALGHAQKEFQGDCIQQVSETAYQEQASQHHTNSDHTQHD